MTALSDTLTIALVIVLLFGSIAIYLYTRIQQAEQKINLLENILLDLKTTSEVKSYMELPADAEMVTGISESQPEPYKLSSVDEDSVTGPAESNTPAATNSYKPFDTEEDDDDLYPGSTARAPVASEDTENMDTIPTQSEATKMSVNYESMTLKELQSIAKQRGISGAGSMKKGPIIEALKTSDRVSTSEAINQIEPGSLSGTSSFVETSSFLTQE